MTMPNFLIIGATKSGTTSLYDYLRQHPQIYMSPIKETNFFAYDGQTIDFTYWGPPPETIQRSITDLASYQKLFEAVDGETAIGEASPYYLYNETAVKRIQQHVPQAKLIIILRHPTDRAYSNYTHLIRDGREPIQNFATALAAEEERKAQNWAWDYYYKDMGRYHHQLKRYLNHFPTNQIKIFLYDELKNDPQKLFQELCHFLGVDTAFQPNFAFHNNMSGYPKNRLLQRFIDQPNLAKPLIRALIPERVRQTIATKLRQLNLQKPEMTIETRSFLNEFYREDIKHVALLIQRDLSNWLD